MAIASQARWGAKLGEVAEMAKDGLTREIWRTGQLPQQIAWVDAQEERWRKGLPLRGPRGEVMCDGLVGELVRLAGPFAPWGEDDVPEAAPLELVPGQRDYIPQPNTRLPAGLRDGTGKPLGVDEVTGDISLVCPAGAQAGSLLGVRLAGGGSRQVVVPYGVEPGDIFFLTKAQADEAVASYNRNVEAHEQAKQTVERMRSAVAGRAGLLEPTASGGSLSTAERLRLKYVPVH
jgi:hypothetical protein